MTRTHYDANYEYYLDYFEGQPVKILKDRKTGEILFDADSVAKVFGYQSAHNMLSRDEVLDIINQIKQQDGVSPLRQTNANHKHNA